MSCLNILLQVSYDQDWSSTSSPFWCPCSFKPHPIGFPTCVSAAGARPTLVMTKLRSSQKTFLYIFCSDYFTCHPPLFVRSCRFATAVNNNMNGNVPITFDFWTSCLTLLHSVARFVGLWNRVFACTMLYVRRSHQLLTLVICYAAVEKPIAFGGQHLTHMTDVFLFALDQL